jgi:hypothetical protein
MLLTHLGFEAHFINWVMCCITYFSFAFLINGSASSFFHAKRGLMQRFHLSSLLFFPIVEALNRGIVEAKSHGEFQGIVISPNLNITHLLFVDDVLIFCNGQRSDVQKLSDILELFGNATGMNINEINSTLSTHNMELEEQGCYMDLFPFEQWELDKGLKYLGFHLKPNNYRKGYWKWILDKLEKRLKGWSFRWLSRASRLVMEKFVLEAIQVYWMSLAWIPKGVLEIARKFYFKFI